MSLPLLNLHCKIHFAVYFASKQLHGVREIVLQQVTNETLVTIFQTILSWHLETGSFPASCKQLGPGIISATLDMYIQSMAKLLPTPTKSHYTFNLRDFARVIQVPPLLIPKMNMLVAELTTWACVFSAAQPQAGCHNADASMLCQRPGVLTLHAPAKAQHALARPSIRVWYAF